MKKGFTLVELLAVLIVLSVIVLITFPIINNSIKESKEKLYNSQIEKIKIGAKDWAYKNVSLLPTEEDETITITLLTLKQSGFLPLDIRDPRNNELIPNDLMITIEYKDNNYNITVDLESGSDLSDEYNENAPTIVLNGNHIEFAEINSLYNEQGAKATSKAGTILSVNITVQNNNVEVANVDTSKFTTYTVIYSAIDNGYTSRITRTVVIRDTTPPNLIIPDKIELTKDQLSNFDIMEGVIATDNSGDIINVETSGFDTTPTDKIVEYKACDSRNNCISKRRLIKIIE